MGGSGEAWQRVGVAGIGGGLGNMIGGGNFGDGFMRGAFREMYNDMDMGPISHSLGMEVGGFIDAADNIGREAYKLNKLAGGVMIDGLGIFSKIEKVKTAADVISRTLYVVSHGKDFINNGINFKTVRNAGLGIVPFYDSVREYFQ